VLPDIFRYLDFRSYLGDCVEALRSAGKFSTRKFAREVGFKSPTTLTHIISGRRNVSPESIKKISAGLSLNKMESEFLKRLVNFTQAKDANEKNEFYKSILNFKSFRETQQTAQAQYDLFSRWYIVALLEALNTPFAKRSISQMAKSLGVTKADVELALEQLVSLGLAKKEGPIWKRVDESLETPNETHSLNIRNFHREMIRIAHDAVDKVPPEKRNLQAISIALSEAEFEALKKKINEFAAEVSSSNAGSKNPHSIYQINFQMFPLLALRTKPR